MVNARNVPGGADRKQRFAGLLENPYVSLIQRDILDLGRWAGLSRTLVPLQARTVLDVGCGLGENSRASTDGYLGLDNSFPRVRFASRRYQQSRFLLADALRLPVKPASFDLVMLIDTSHHLTDAQFRDMLAEMRRVSRQWVLVSDPVVYVGQNRLSRFFYSLDRGAMFRDTSRMEQFFKEQPGLRLVKTDHFVTFPALYRHGVFLLHVEN